jgi:hypothetical protein
MPKKSDVSVNPNEAFSQIPKSNPLQDDFGWTIPVENVPLPSLGKIYPVNSTLHGRETVQIKAMTAQEEDILLSRALLKDGTVLTHLINSCLIDKSINARDLVAGDRNALLVSVRITGYGSEYKAEVACPSCSTRQNATFDLADLEIKRLQAEPVTPGSNNFEFMLPVTKKRVVFKLLTGRDEEEITAIQERRRRAMPDIVVENVVTSRLENSIISIDGITDRNKLNSFIRSMPAYDSRSLRAYMNDIEPGIDMNGRLSCVKCGVESPVPLPLGASFFWP